MMIFYFIFRKKYFKYFILLCLRNKAAKASFLIYEWIVIETYFFDNCSKMQGGGYGMLLPKLWIGLGVPQKNKKEKIRKKQ